MRGVHAVIEQPPHRGRRGRRAEDMRAVTASLPDPVDAVRAVGDRGSQIGEHIPRCMHPRAPVGVRQSSADLRRQPSLVCQLTQHAHPGVRHHTMTVGRDFHPRHHRDTLHLRSAFPPEQSNRREVRLFLAGQAFSLIYTPPHTTFREKSRLIPNSQS